MSYAIPSGDLPPEEKKNFRRATIEACTHRAVQLGIAPGLPDLTIRGLRPDDLGLKSWATPELENSWVTWISNPIPSNAVIGVFKCLQLSMEPKVSSIRFSKGYTGVTRLALFELEPCYGGLPILQNLKKALLDPVARQVLDTLSGSEEEIRPILCSQMEAYFSEPIIVEDNTVLTVEVLSYSKAPPDYLVLGGFTVEPAGTTIS